MKRTIDSGASNEGSAIATSETTAPHSLPLNHPAAINPQPTRRISEAENARSIELHIHQLVLHGFSHGDRRPIAEAIERELSTLLSAEGLALEHSFEIEHVNGGSFQVSETARRESAGADVARAIYGGLRQ